MSKVVPIWRLALDNRAQRVYVELGRLIEAEGAYTLKLGDLVRGKHLADNVYLVAQLADRV
eukprot:3235272-Pleurochrysis_carterae.AAC.1